MGGGRGPTCAPFPRNFPLRGRFQKTPPLRRRFLKHYPTLPTTGANRPCAQTTARRSTGGVFPAQLQCPFLQFPLCRKYTVCLCACVPVCLCACVPVTTKKPRSFRSQDPRLKVCVDTIASWAPSTQTAPVTTKKLPSLRSREPWVAAAAPRVLIRAPPAPPPCAVPATGVAPWRRLARRILRSGRRAPWLQ